MQPDHVGLPLCCAQGILPMPGHHNLVPSVTIQEQPSVPLASPTPVPGYGEHEAAAQ